MDDRELARIEDDRFRHRDVAEQLAELSATVETPANIALYGPWGSGKTGVANMLREKLEDADFRRRHGRMAFTRFDAFKYSEVPLRRHFISQVSEDLLGEEKAKTFRRRLYHSETRTELDFKSLDIWRAVLVFALLLVVGFVIAVIVAAVAAFGMEQFTDGGEFGARFRTYFAGVIGFSFAPAVVLGGLFAIAGKALPVQRSTDTPSTDEQFEREFKILLDAALKEHNCKRLVVFVDELDRCGPERVVDVLDTVRTFLDVEGTVFVIAADRYVLEKALDRRLEQMTPPDPTNPYYSSGSAYLDKVFHYQLNLPALLPVRVTRYAVELVEGREGVWSEDHVDVAWVVSVLVPTHVRSPRRVKTLLNNYVLAFRLARRRHEEGHLSSDPSDRALELAKLVCLRTEFPGFARELTLSTRLPDYFLSLAANKHADKPHEVSDEAWSKARSFVLGELAVDEMLDETETQSQEESATAGPVSNSMSNRSATDTQTALRQQLYHYLLRTRHIPSPRRDLVFLEGQGHLFDLEESLAEQIEDAAVGGRADDVIRVVDDQDVSRQAAIVRFLAQRAREAFPGVEGENLVGVLLGVASGRSVQVLADCADDAVEAVSAHSERTELRPEDLPGAFLLGLRSRRGSASALVRQVLEHPDATDNPSLGSEILRHADQAFTFDEGGRLGRIANRLLLDRETAATTVDALHGSGSAGLEVMETAIPVMTTSMDEAAESPEIANDQLLACEDALERALEVDAQGIARAILVSLYQSNRPENWADAGHFLNGVAPVDAAELVRAIVNRANGAEPARTASWLASLSDGVAALDGLPEQLAAFVESLWAHRRSWEWSTSRTTMASLVPCARLFGSRIRLISIEDRTYSRMHKRNSAQLHLQMHTCLRHKHLGRSSIGSRPRDYCLPLRPL